MDYFLFNFSGVQFHYTMSLTYKNNLLELYVFCICYHWFYEKFNFKN